MRNWSVSLKAVFVLVLIEGALRKWVLPGSADMVYFIKDVVLVGVYLGFWIYGPGNRRRSTPPQWLPRNGLRFCLVPIIFLSFNPNIGSVAATLLGARGYLFYLPIVLIIPYVFDDKKTMVRQVSIYALLSIPICLLAVVQFKSDSFSVINTYAAGTTQWGASKFGGSDGAVRVTGTFSYLSGHVVFACAFFALTIALVAGSKTPFRRVLAFVALPLLLGNIFMSGSRAAFLAGALTATGLLSCQMGAVTMLGRWRAKKTIFIAGLGLVAVVGYVFTDAAKALYDRQNRVNDSLAIRVIEMPAEHLAEGWDRGGLLGCGIGTTSPGVRVLRARLHLPPLEHHPGVYDLELGQVMAEVGLVGFVAWYGFRVLIVLSIWRAYNRCQDEQLRVFILATFFLWIPFFLLSLVLNHVACVLMWGLTGLSLAAVRFSTPRPIAEQQVRRGHIRTRAA